MSSHSGYKSYKIEIDIPYGNGIKILEVHHSYPHHHELVQMSKFNLDEDVTHRSGGVIIDPRT